MKKIIPALALSAMLAMPQVNGQTIDNEPPKTVENWQNLSYESDGVYGAAVNEAWGLAKGLKSKKKIVVALIGPGIDIGQEDIKHAIWSNPKDKQDKKDNDRNGLLNDTHGWNFLGTPGGEALNEISRAGDREFFRLKEKYGDYLQNDGKFYRIDEQKDELVEVPSPADLAEYYYFRNEVLADSRIGSQYVGQVISRVVTMYVKEFDKELRAKFPDKTDFTQADFRTLIDQACNDTLRNASLALTSMMFTATGGDAWSKVLDYSANTHLQQQKSSYERSLRRMVLNERGPVGDDPYDIGDTSYGNNNLMAENAPEGTMLAGVIAAKRGNGVGIDGVDDRVKVMTLRIDVANFTGEPYMKDMALAIRYAVDHGADIIQMGKTNTFFPRPWSQWVVEALRYAESKGVLVVIPMMDLSYNLDDQPFYPRRFVDGEPELTNVITVAASDAAGNPYLKSNFSPRELDLFAPGVGIQSALPGNTYGTASGSYFAASMVAGVAALVKSYYPAITPEQMRGLLMETVTSREGAEVEKEFSVFVKDKPSGTTKDLFLFEELSVAPGILNAYKALEAAARYK